MLNFNGSDDSANRFSLFVAINPPLPTLIILGCPVDAMTMFEYLQLPKSPFSSPIPADASSIVVIPLFLQYFEIILVSCSAAYPAKLVYIKHELSEISKSSNSYGLIRPKSVLSVIIFLFRNL